MLKGHKPEVTVEDAAPTKPKEEPVSETTPIKKEVVKETEEAPVIEEKEYDLATNVISKGAATKARKAKDTDEILHPELDNALEHYYVPAGKATSPIRTVKGIFSNVDKIDGLDKIQQGALGEGEFA